jgi:iron complex outermembrane receptor protein
VRPLFASSDGLGVLTLTRKHGASTGYLKLYYDDGSIDWRQWDDASEQSFSTLTDWSNWGLRAREHFSVLGRGTITTGADLDSYGGRSVEVWPSAEEPLGEFRFRNAAGYVAYQHSFGTTVEVTPSGGVRYNDSRDFGGQWGGQAGVAVSGGFGKLHLRYAHAFNLPGVWTAMFYEDYGRGDQWRTLSPEHMDHWELGYGYTIGSKAHVDVLLFRNGFSDALRFIPPPPPPPSFANVGSYRSRGVEASLMLTPLPGLSLMAGATFIDNEPDEVPFAPGTSWVAGAVYHEGRLRVSLDVQHVGKNWVGNPRFPGSFQTVEPFTLLNARVAWRIGSLGQGTEVYVAGENLADSEYEYRPGYPMPGASVMGGLSWGF